MKDVWLMHYTSKNKISFLIKHYRIHQMYNNLNIITLEQSTSLQFRLSPI